MTPEFELIARHFTRPPRTATLGVGDDCALFSWPSGRDVAVSTDTLVAGNHFFADTDAESLGHKALAVNLSDLAAMGATPRYVTLALTLPRIDHDWLAAFANGFFSLAEAFGVELIGGDTTRGPLSVTLTVIGEADPKNVLRRDRAREGDEIWISGDLGGAALALRRLRNELVLAESDFAVAAGRLHRPLPRVALGRALSGLAHAAIDVSDGLLADLGHICERSRLAAAVVWPQVPLSAPLRTLPQALQLACALSGGDDYELCFTAPAAAGARIETLAGELALPLTRIGRMAALTGTVAAVMVTDVAGRAITVPAAGYDHFAGDR